MSNADLSSSSSSTSPPTRQDNPSSLPGSKATDTARYTPQQEREMGISDGQGGPKVQPSGAFAMIALTYVFVAAVAIVIVAIIMHYTGNSAPSTMSPP